MGTSKTIKAGLRARPPIVEGRLSYEVDVSGCLWQLERKRGYALVTLSMAKVNPHKYWPALISGPREPDDPDSIDTNAIYLLGKASATGKGGTPKDTHVAFQHLLKAAERGHVL